MTLVIRSNYGDDSIALIEALYTQEIALSPKQEVYVVYIDTHWAASTWPQRVRAGEDYVKKCGFKVVHLESKATFANLVQDRKSFPTPKYQWCAGFLKGLPLIEWLDEHDPACEWVVVLPKRQSLYRTPLTALKKACSYHGERAVWHPMLTFSDEKRNQLVQQAGFACLGHRSLECDPCVNSTLDDLNRLSKEDSTKLKMLEIRVNKPMFPHGPALTKKSTAMDAFTMGCGDPFACGL